MNKEEEKILQPTARYYLKYCENFDFQQLDSILNHVSSSIEEDYNLHLSHHRASIFFNPKEFRTQKSCFAGFEVIGQKGNIVSGAENLKAPKNDGDFVIFDLEACSWLRSSSFGEFLHQDLSREFSKKVFNYLDNLHNRGYSEDLGARFLLDFKSADSLIAPDFYIEFSEETIIDIGRREK